MSMNMSRDDLEARLADLRSQCTRSEQQLAILRSQIAETQQYLQASKAEEEHAEKTRDGQPADNAETSAADDQGFSTHANNNIRTVNEFPLTAEEYKRYGRQLIVPEIGAPGQAALRRAKVLVVGVGGLGCPAAAYLAGAGVGTIGLVDGDNVEASNLHRQIAHSTQRVGMSKVASAHAYLQSLNPLVKYEQHTQHLTPERAVHLFEQYELVLDCTDHPTSRYLISDACVLAERPLVSASALKTDGQLIVLNHPARPAGDLSGGPCYRCIFPKPPPADTVLSCGEGGILGPVVGVMGVLQALEAIKLLTARPAEPSHTSPPAQPPRTSMLLFSAYGETQFRTIKMRSRRPACSACSDCHTITRESLTSGSLDYVAFCGTRQSRDLRAAHQMTATTLSQRGLDPSSTIIDVRDKTQYEICSLQSSINIPWTGDAVSWQRSFKDAKVDPSDHIYLICRLGNDSKAATQALLETHPDIADKIVDITGGFHAWRENVDSTWPDY